MFRELTLTECNLASTCYHEESTIIYPKTIADQVVIDDNGTKLSDWINNLVIPGSISITSLYQEDSNFNIATINNIKIGLPYITGIDEHSHSNGLPKFDLNYFTISGENKIQFSLGWSLNKDVFGDDTIELGNIINVNRDAITNIKFPQPYLSYEYVSEEPKHLDIHFLLGSHKEAAVSIPQSVFAAMCPSTVYNIFTGATNLNDGSSGLVPAPTTQDVNKFLKGNGEWTTLEVATVSTPGLMDASDKDKLDNIEEGAQKNNIIEVNGVTITPISNKISINDLTLIESSNLSVFNLTSSSDGVFATKSSNFYLVKTILLLP